MELDLLEKRIRRLVCKLNKHNIHLEVFDHTDIEYGHILGKGGEGEVRKCTVVYKDVPVEAAVKTVLDTSDDAINITLEEIELLCLARDPIINTTLQVYGVAAVPDDNDPEIGHLVIVTEAGLMNALQLYQQEEVPLVVTFDLWKRVAAALHMMHDRRIIHHDLKPENILVTTINRNRNGQLERIGFKVIDLGMGKRVFTDRVVTDDVLGTQGYHAPEVLLEDSYDFKADIFMLGITFCVLLHSSTFLRSKHNLKNLLKSIHSAKCEQVAGRKLYDRIIRPSLDNDQNIPQAVSRMICDMLARQSRRTISLLDVVRICDEEAAELGLPGGHVGVLAPLGNCQDSGIDSGGRTRRTRRLNSSRKTQAHTSRKSSRSSPPPPIPEKPARRPGVGSTEVASLLEAWRGSDVLLSRRTRCTRSSTTPSPAETPSGSSGRPRRKCTDHDATSRQSKTKRSDSCTPSPEYIQLRKRRKINYCDVVS